MVGDLQKAFGRGVRAERQRRGLSQEEFAAEVLDVHRTFAGAVERGERNLTLRSVERLAEAVGVEPLVLFTTDDGVVQAAGSVRHRVEPVSSDADDSVLRAAEDGGPVTADLRPTSSRGSRSR